MAGFADFVMGSGALKKAAKSGDAEPQPKQSDSYNSSELLKRNEEAAARDRERRAKQKKAPAKKTSQVIGEQMMDMG